MNELVGRKNVAVWDERRNTSRVMPVPPGALDEAVQSLLRLRQSDPQLVRWIEDGHPTLTEEEHWQRFGESYMRGGRKR